MQAYQGHPRASLADVRLRSYTETTFPGGRSWMAEKVPRAARGQGLVALAIVVYSMALPSAVRRQWDGRRANPQGFGNLDVEPASKGLDSRW